LETFRTVLHRAAYRHGGEDMLMSKISSGQMQHDSAPKSDERWLAEFTKRVFQAGFSWKVIEAKWAGFEEVFWKFNIARCARIDLDDMEKLTTDKRIVRNPVKIKTVAPNAAMIQKMSEEAGSADKFIRYWPRENFIGLLEYLQKNGSHLGPNTACYALRFSGVPSFILSKDVTAALIHADIIDKPATSKRAKLAVQNAFNSWHDETGHDFTTLSRILAMSIDG